MADDVRKLTHTAAELDDNVDEVEEARGTYDTLKERLEAIEARLTALEGGAT